MLHDFSKKNASTPFIKTQELELIRVARDEAQAQAENEAAQKDEERKRREEKGAREIENEVKK